MKLRAVLCLLLAAVPAAAQTSERSPLFAIDIHAATVGLPQAEGWVPVGVARHPAARPQLGRRRRRHGLSLSARLRHLRHRRVADHREREERVADHRQRIRQFADDPRHADRADRHHQPGAAVVDQFRAKLGWSYLSAGIGRSKVTSSADAVGTTPADRRAGGLEPSASILAAARSGS